MHPLRVTVPLLSLVAASCTSCRTTPPPQAAPIVLPAPTLRHPRLYLTAAKLAEIRAGLDSTYAHLWNPIRRETNARLDDTPPDALEGDFRRVGEKIPFAALCYLLTGDSVYRDLAVRTMSDLADHARWGNDIDIEAAHLLYAMAVGYDWLYPELSPEQRDRFRAKLALQAARMRPRCGQRHPPLNNHRIVNLSALGTAALALLHEVPDAREWLEYVECMLYATLKHYGSDGLSCEGISYWSYTVEYLLKYLAAVPGNEHALFAHPWIRSAALAPVYHFLPRGAWSDNNLVLNIGDSPRFCWYGPQYQLYYLADRYNEPRAQWLADQLARADYTREHADWLNLLWYNPAVPREEPPGAPPSHYFRDWDLAVMHGGGTNRTVCSFKCGPAGSGHSQPDANSFTVFSRGAWLVADAGATLTKRTSYHNTVLVNGIGQKGEGGRWLDRSVRSPDDAPRIVLARRKPDSDYFVGDASNIYREKARLTRFHRHFLYERPGRITIVDQLAAKRPARFDWLLHTPGTIEIENTTNIAIRTGDARLDLRIIQPEEAVVRVESVPIETEYPDHDWTRLNRLIITPATASRHTTFSIVMELQ